MSQTFTKSQVAEHKDDKSMYIIIDDGVYDITSMFFSVVFALPSSGLSHISSLCTSLNPSLASCSIPPAQSSIPTHSTRNPN